MIYGLLTVAAICFAAWAPRDERIAAYWSGVFILTGWGLWTLSMGENGPAFWLDAVGVVIDPIDIWAVTDLATAAAILIVANIRWWSVSLWLLLSVQIALHCCYMHGGLSYQPYEDALDFFYLGQLAVLFAIGGPGAVDSLLDWCWKHRRIHAAGKDRAAQKETSAQ